MISSARQTTVLIVDDDEDFVTQQRAQLEAAGFAILTASSQAEAEELLARGRPDIAIVDLMMEHTDAGFALCYHIKKLDPAIGVILVSNVTSETGIEFDAATDEERSWVKADAFLAKPLRFEQLLGQMERLLSEKETTSAGMQGMQEI